MILPGGLAELTRGARPRRAIPPRAFPFRFQLCSGPTSNSFPAVKIAGILDFSRKSRKSRKELNLENGRDTGILISRSKEFRFGYEKEPVCILISSFPRKYFY